MKGRSPARFVEVRAPDELIAFGRVVTERRGRAWIVGFERHQPCTSEVRNAPDIDSEPLFPGRVTTRHRSSVPRPWFVKPAAKGVGSARSSRSVLNPERRYHALCTTMNVTTFGFWACYHTDMWEWEENGQRFGIVGCAVGASFAVLIAEQLFVSGCELLVSVASAGQIAISGRRPTISLSIAPCATKGRAITICRPASSWVPTPPCSRCRTKYGWGTRQSASRCHVDDDAPFRETAETITKRRREGVLAVEMEAAALYAPSVTLATNRCCALHM